MTLSSGIRIVALAALCSAPIAITLTATPIGAQQATPNRLQAVSRVDLANDFERVKQYNAQVALANAAREQVPGLRKRARLGALAGIGFVALAVTQYLEFSRQLDIGDGSGSDVPALISSLSIGGAIGGWAYWFTKDSEADAAEATERGHLTAARALLPQWDPARR